MRTQTRVYSVANCSAGYVTSKSRPRSEILKRAAAPVFLFMVLSLQLLVRVSILHTSYEIEHHRSGIVAIQNKIQEYRLELVQHTHPIELRDRAERELALAAPKSARLRQLTYTKG
jgi:hypothetical protein